MLLAAVAALALFAGTANATAPLAPRIGVVNQNSGLSDAEIQAALPAFQDNIDTAIGPAWHVNATLYFGRPRPGDWQIDVRPQPAGVNDVCGYHDFNLGRPIAYIYVGLCPDWTVTFSHELDEMLVDPETNRLALVSGLPNKASSPNISLLVEVSDPVTPDTFELDGITMSDFVYPVWYRPKAHKGPFDQAGALNAPLEIDILGGYALAYYNGQWTMLPEVYGRRRTL